MWYLFHDAVRYRSLVLSHRIDHGYPIPIAWDCLVRHFPAMRMAGYQCLMPMASLVLETTRQTPHREDAARGTGGTAGLRQNQTFQNKMGQIIV